MDVDRTQPADRRAGQLDCVHVHLERHRLAQASPADAVARSARLADFAQFTGVGVCRIDLDLKIIVEANDAISAIYGYEPSELLGADPGVLTGRDPPEDAAAADLGTLTEQLRRGRQRTNQGERVVTRRDGHPARVRVALASSPGADGRFRYLTAIVQDVTEQHAAAERIRYQALHDSLTGLANRVQLAQLITEAAARPESQRGHVAVLFLDLDQFKLVNDALGHVAGDELLRAGAQRFNMALVEPETVIRFGGDEFVVFCPGIYRIEDAEELARRLLSSLHTPFTVGSRDVFVTAGVGISLSAEPDAERMLREADAAMHRAKALGAGRIAVFDPTLLDRSNRDLQLAAPMYDALAEQQFVLDYQPIVELATGRIAGLEALVRWEHPTEGRLLPSEFVVVAQRTGMIRPLGGWILRRACTDARVWQETHPEVAVHVNLSPAQLVDTLPDEVGAALAASGVASERLVLEMTRRR